MRPAFHHGRTGLALAVIALVAVAAGVAYATAASTNSASAVITACQNNTNGLLRVVPDASACREAETAVSWNVQGPPGEQGPPGPAGSGGGALAFAHVLADGTIDTARSSDNVLAVTTGVVTGTSTIRRYCFDLSVAPKNIVATIENSVQPQPPPMTGSALAVVPINATIDPSVAASWGCAAGTDAAVIPDLALPFYVLFN